MSIQKNIGILVLLGILIFPVTLGVCQCIEIFYNLETYTEKDEEVIYLTHTVREGESFSSIVDDYMEKHPTKLPREVVLSDTIIKSGHGYSTNHIEPGEKLKLPLIVKSRDIITLDF